MCFRVILEVFGGFWMISLWSWSRIADEVLDRIWRILGDLGLFWRFLEDFG